MTALVDDGVRAWIDLERYPIEDLATEQARAVVAAQRHSLAQRGAAILPGFVKPEAVADMARVALALQPRAHLEDIHGTPYLAAPDETFPDGHPRRTLCHSLTWVIAYDLVPLSAPIRALYEWEPLKDFIGEVLERRPLYRMSDPLGALNLTVMEEGHVQGWHYDNAEFVVSLALQASDAGGKFECAPFIRSADDENYDTVARVLAEQAPDQVEVFPMVPGTLMIFAGRRSVHRVSPVVGHVPRVVALLAYDTRSESDSSDVFKLLRYGRSEAYTPPERL